MFTGLVEAVGELMLQTANVRRLRSERDGRPATHHRADRLLGLLKRPKDHVVGRPTATPIRLDGAR